MQASPWFIELLGRSPRWHPAAWLFGLMALALGVGWGMGMITGMVCTPDRRADTGRRLTQLRQGIELGRARAGGEAGCPEALAVATAAGSLSEAIDGWDRPVQIRCYGDTLVLRSQGLDVHDPFDDVVVVAPMAARATLAVSENELLR